MRNSLFLLACLFDSINHISGVFCCKMTNGSPLRLLYLTTGLGFLALAVTLTVLQNGKRDEYIVYRHIPHAVDCNIFESVNKTVESRSLCNGTNFNNQFYSTCETSIIDFRWLVFVIMMSVGVHHMFVATLYWNTHEDRLENGPGSYIKYIEYAITSSAVFVLAVYSAGVQNFDVLILLACLCGFSRILCMFHLSCSNSDSKTLTPIIFFTLSLIVLIAPWVYVISQFFINHSGNLNLLGWKTWYYVFGTFSMHLGFTGIYIGDVYVKRLESRTGRMVADYLYVLGSLMTYVPYAIITSFLMYTQ